MMYKYPILPANYRDMYPKINASELRIMWHCGYYDGPLDGVIQFRNKAHWFFILHDDYVAQIRVDDEEAKWQDLYQRFLLIELSQEQFQEEKYWNELFRVNVGTYWDYDENGKRKKDGYFKPKTQHKLFYDAAKKRLPCDYSNNKIVGWFEWVWGSSEVDEIE
jgi:hypothetical protein